MDNKNKELKQEQKVPRLFEKADFVLTCHSCGNVDVLHKDLETGLRIELFPTDTHKLSLGCSKCKAAMTLSFKEVIDTGVVNMDGESVVRRESDKGEPAEIVEPADEQIPTAEQEEPALTNDQEVTDEKPVLEEDSEKESV